MQPFITNPLNYNNTAALNDKIKNFNVRYHQVIFSPCTRTQTHTCTHTHIYTKIYTYMHECMYARMHAHTYTRTCMNTHMYVLFFSDSSTIKVLHCQSFALSKFCILQFYLLTIYMCLCHSVCGKERSSFACVIHIHVHRDSIWASLLFA